MASCNGDVGVEINREIHNHAVALIANIKTGSNGLL